MDEARLNGARNLKKRRVNKTKHLISKKKEIKMKGRGFSEGAKFTLIEFLITIAIIAILASLLLPALNSAKAKGQAIACGGNLRSCGIALQQYTGDNQDCMPYTAAIYDESAFRYKESWECKLGYYMGWSSKMGGAVFHCPARPVVKDGFYPDFHPRNSCGYAVYNPMCFGNVTGWISKITRVQRPSATMYLTEREGGPSRREVPAPFINAVNVSSVGIGNDISAPHGTLMTWVLCVGGNAFQFRFPNKTLHTATFR